MLMLLNTVLKHALSVSTLMFVIFPFVTNLTQGSINVGGMSTSMPSMAGIESTIASLAHGNIASMGASSGMYLSGAHPIFLN